MWLFIMSKLPLQTPNALQKRIMGHEVVTLWVTRWSRYRSRGGHAHTLNRSTWARWRSTSTPSTRSRPTSRCSGETTPCKICPRHRPAVGSWWGQGGEPLHISFGVLVF